MPKPADIDAYISGYPKEIQKMLQQLRSAIRKAAPEAYEVISYSMPGFKCNGMLVWFGAYAHHIGLYPMASGIAAFREELSAYKGAKGSVQFPLDQPLPIDLIARIVRFRVAENLQKAAAKESHQP